MEGTKYSHVYLRWTSTAGPEVVYEASGTRVRFLNSRIFDSIAETLHTYTFLISEEDYRKLIKFVMTNVGVEYGLKQVLGIALVRIFGLSKNPFSDGKDTQVCSETVAYFLKEILGYQIDFDVDMAGPKKIHTYLENFKKSRS